MVDTRPLFCGRVWPENEASVDQDVAIIGMFTLILNSNGVIMLLVEVSGGVDCGVGSGGSSIESIAMLPWRIIKLCEVRAALRYDWRGMWCVWLERCQRDDNP